MLLFSRLGSDSVESLVSSRTMSPVGVDDKGSSMVILDKSKFGKEDWTCLRQSSNPSP